MITLLCGKIASGKTTYATKQKQSHENLITLSVDACMLELSESCAGRAAHVKMESGILAYFYFLCIQLHEQGMDVILDHGYWLEEERIQASRFFEMHDIPYQFLYFPISIELQSHYLNLRNAASKKQKQYHITQDRLAFFNDFFEEPDPKRTPHLNIYPHENQ